MNKEELENFNGVSFSLLCNDCGSDHALMSDGENNYCEDCLFKYENALVDCYDCGDSFDSDDLTVINPDEKICNECLEYRKEDE
jgi:hypothetical protein